MRNVRLALGLIAYAAVLPGCRGSNDGAPGTTAPLPAGVKQMAMTVTRNRMINGESKTDRVDTFPNPSKEEIEKQLKAVDWVNTDLRVTVSLGKEDTAGHHWMRIERFDGSPGMAGVRALWQARENGRSIGRRTDVDSIDEAVGMMQAFHQGDTGLATKAHWESVPE